jgi:hypothetical protein
VQKHGITFEEAAEVFLDPFYQTGDASTDDEQRDFIMGYSLSQRAVLPAMRGSCMKKPEDELEKEFEIKFRPRETETVSIEIPKDTLASLKKVAASRDMAVQALLKFYIGQGLRHDLARLFGDRVLETTEQVLARHMQSQEEISSIIREIRSEAVG